MILSQKYYFIFIYVFVKNYHAQTVDFGILEIAFLVSLSILALAPVLGVCSSSVELWTILLTIASAFFANCFLYTVSAETFGFTVISHSIAAAIFSSVLSDISFPAKALLTVAVPIPAFDAIASYGIDRLSLRFFSSDKIIFFSIIASKKYHL